jgi:hypothetical protein
VELIKRPEYLQHGFDEVHKRMHLEEEDEALSPGGCTNVESEP